MGKELWPPASRFSKGIEPPKLWVVSDYKKFPMQYNSIMNASLSHRNDLYLLIKAPEIITTAYTICQLKSFRTPACHTRYSRSGTAGSQLGVTCEDKNDLERYEISNDNATTITAPDWLYLAADWATSLALNTGVEGRNVSLPRILSLSIHNSSMIDASVLNSVKPTISETLAVLSSNTSLQGSDGASFHDQWMYGDTQYLQNHVSEEFNATIKSQ